jgi:uncharacterized protein YceH (UPF0502 family)
MPPIDPNAPARWKPLNAIDRRVLGVLVEKAKTTPEQYPLSLNALLTGCNQKSNRHPVLNLDDGDVIMSVDRLRMMGVVAEVQGGGRVPRYRHYANEWLAVERADLSIMTELLLRGSQTEGELRTRVARMDEIADLETLRKHLEHLQSRGLVQSLTPPGRGHVVTHCLYEPRELEAEKAKFSAMAAAEVLDDEPAPASSTAVVYSRPATAQHAAATPKAATADNQELQDVKNQLAELRSEVNELREKFEVQETELRRLRDALGG